MAKAGIDAKIMASRGLELPPVQNQFDNDRNEYGRAEHE